MGEILKFVIDPVSKRAEVFCYFIRIFQAIILTNLYMNHLGYFFDKSIVIDFSSIIDFILSYKMMMIIVIYTFSVSITFLLINILYFSLLILMPALSYNKNVVYKSFDLQNYIKKDKLSKKYFFSNNNSKEIIKMLYQEFSDFNYESTLFVKMRVYLSILIVSWGIYSYYDLKYCLPMLITNVFYFIVKFCFFSSLFFLHYAVSLQSNIGEIYDSLIKNEYEKNTNLIINEHS